MEKPDGVWRAPRIAGAPLDLTKDIISLTQSVGAGLVPAHALIIELDNSKGQYAPDQFAIHYSPFTIDRLKRSEVVLKLGYRTTAGSEAVEAGTYWIDGWEYRSATLQGRATGESTFTLHCLDGSGLMDRWSARYQMRWNKDDVNPKSVWQILYQLLARVGIKLTDDNWPQSSAINNFYPDFTITAGTQGTQALKKLLSFVPDGLVFRGQDAFTKNPLPAEASCYTYSVGAGLVPAHPIISGKYTDAVTASRARAIGQDEDANRIVQDAFDWDLLSLAIDVLEQVYDPNLQTAESAQERADAILRTQQTQSTPATLIVPTNVGQELLDVVKVTDARCGISENNYRVRAIQTDYDRRKATYEQKLTLGAP